MANHYVTNMQHLVVNDQKILEENPELRRLIDLQGGVVEAASSYRTSGPIWQSALRCPRRPARKPCGGRYKLSRQDVPSTIEWQCPLCGESGTITNWQKTKWDLTRYRPGTKDEAHASLPAADYDAFFREVLLSEGSLCILRAGEFGEGDHVYLAADIGNWVDLIEETAALANHCKSPTRRRRLERAFAVLADASQDAEA